MKIELFSACQSATTRGKLLDVVGMFGPLHIPFFPFELDRLVIAARIRFEAEEECGLHDFTISTADEDSISFGPDGVGKFEVSPDGDDFYVWRNAVVSIPTLKIESPMDLEIELRIDGQLVASTCVLFQKESKI